MHKVQINTQRAPAAIGPYSQAIDLGSLVITSGQIPVDPATGVIACGIRAQAEQCLKNLQAILEESGSGMDKVVKTTVFLSDLNDFADFNEIYGTFLGQPYPARSCVQAARLPKDVLLEIEAVALK